jgi:hypothetical protein
MMVAVIDLFDTVYTRLQGCSSKKPRSVAGLFYDVGVGYEMGSASGLQSFEGSIFLHFAQSLNVSQLPSSTVAAGLYSV